MRLAFSVRQKIRIATLLFAVMACSVLIRFLEDKSVKDMNASFVSMYNDRLIPATDLFYIAENAHAKKSLFEEILYTTEHPLNTAAEHLDKIQHYNDLIGGLILKYKKTLLVKEEQLKLIALDNTIQLNNAIENEVLKLIRSRNMEFARSRYEAGGRNAANQFSQKLAELMAIQQQVGEELIKDSAFMISGNKLYSSLQVALAIVIGILIVGIIFTTNVVKISNDKFNLN